MLTNYIISCYTHRLLRRCTVQKDKIMRKNKPIFYSLMLLSCIYILGTSTLFANPPADARAASSKAPTISTKPALATKPTQTKAQQLLSGMSLDNKLAQLIMVDYMGTSYTASGLQQMVAQQHVGGVLYQPGDP